MTLTRVLSATAFLTAVAACGTHESVAPVVYGGQDQGAGRIYNSPQESAAPRRPIQPTGYTPPRVNVAQPVAQTAVTQVELEPVSSIYLSDEQRASAVQEAAIAPAAPPSERVAIVRKGDTVYALGRRYNVEPQSIIAANNLRAPYHLTIGQRVRVPGATPVAQSQPAPVAAKTAAKTTPVRQATYRVQKGDTLYAISRQTGVSVSKLAQANGLQSPYTIEPGQVIRTPGAATAPLPRMTEKAPTRTAKLETPKAQDPADLTRKVSFTPPTASDALFAWPVRGAVISQYGVGEMGRRNDGINIAAPAGTPVRAAAAGEVVYRGSELDGFGNLLLVKHTDGFVTAYAHNDAMLVDKGDVVRKGQVIAKVGQSGSVTTPQLHFEIRQKLKSVDPLALLEDN